MGAHNVSPGSTDQHKVTFLLEGANGQSSNYPGWFIGKVEDDITLIKLPQDVTLNRKRKTNDTSHNRVVTHFQNKKNRKNKKIEWIQPARLPYSDDPKQVGDPVVMTGWGNFSNVGNTFQVKLNFNILNN
jgi:elastase-2